MGILITGNPFPTFEVHKGHGLVLDDIECLVFVCG